jgi:hypothetical protein
MQWEVGVQKVEEIFCRCRITERANTRVGMALVVIIPHPEPA